MKTRNERSQDIVRDLGINHSNNHRHCIIDYAVSDETGGLKIRVGASRDNACNYHRAQRSPRVREHFTTIYNNLIIRARVTLINIHR